MLLRTKPTNMKKRLTRGNGVAERIISEEEVVAANLETQDQQ